GAFGTMIASTGSEAAMLTRNLFRLLSHQCGIAIGTIARDSSMTTNGKTLHSGKLYSSGVDGMIFSVKYVAAPYGRTSSVRWFPTIDVQRPKAMLAADDIRGKTH